MNNLEKDEVEDLCIAIFRQAADDYRYLLANHKKEAYYMCSSCGIAEIEEFFAGDWAREILQGMNITDISGPELLRKAMA